MIKNDFVLQYHITAKCSNKCKHCYIFDKSYQSEIEKELPRRYGYKILNDYIEMLNKLNKEFGIELQPRIFFTGGDPLLRLEDLIEFLRVANNLNMKIGILGNPELLDEKIIKILKYYNVRSYQLSIDGNKEYHEYMRGENTYNKAISAIKLLNEANIKSAIMYNLTKQNINQLIPTIYEMIKNKVKIFTFGRVVEYGNAKQIKDNLIAPDEYKELLHSIQKEFNLISNRTKIEDTEFHLRDPLFSLVFEELGLLEKLNKKDIICGGCEMGISFMAIQANGDVVACRRFPSKVGNVTRESLYDIFVHSKEYEKYRNYNKYDCIKCNLFQYCRGCPAKSQGIYDDFYKKDPQCWKEL